MLKTRNFGRRLSTAALGLGFIGILLWLLSYVWILFRLTGRETEAVWSFVVAVEIGAMIAGLSSILLGAISRWRYAERNSADFRNATRGIMLGATVWFCLVVFNLVGILFS
jgi:hypothetical protein